MLGQNFPKPVPWGCYFSGILAYVMWKKVLWLKRLARAELDTCKWEFFTKDSSELFMPSSVLRSPRIPQMYLKTYSFIYRESWEINVLWNALGILNMLFFLLMMEWPILKECTDWQEQETLQRQPFSRPSKAQDEVAHLITTITNTVHKHKA